MARNAAISLKRGEHSHYSLQEHHSDIAEENKALSQQLHENIALLDEPDRTIVNLILEGYSYAEIAEKTGMNEKNVSVRLVRAKRKLREMMTLPFAPHRLTTAVGK